MKQVFKKGTKIQVVLADSDNWYKVGEIYTVHSYLEHEDAYVVEEQYEVYKDSAWIDAKDVEMCIDWYTKGQLPPVGSVCLHAPCDPYIDPFEVTILAHHKFHGDDYKCAVWVNENDVAYSSVEYFMPMLPTPKKEQEMNEWKYGLPPVNTEFEYSFGNGYWFKATSTYVVGDSGVVALCETMESVVEQYLDNEDCEFRPIKSKEQQEKEDAIAEMVKVADPMWESQIKAEAMCKRLFNAGWRKVE